MNKINAPAKAVTHTKQAQRATHRIGLRSPTYLSIPQANASQIAEAHPGRLRSATPRRPLKWCLTPFPRVLLGDASKAREKLGWKPKNTLEELVKEMVRADLKTAERDELVKRHGYYANTCHE